MPDWGLHVDSFLAEHGGEFVVRVSDSWKNRLAFLIRKARRGEAPRGEKKTLDQIAREIRDDLDLSDFNRAKKIARTETLRASNFASFTGIVEADVSDRKEFIATNDNRTRSRGRGDRFDHLAADGEIVPILEPFVRTGESLMYPNDPAGSAGNTIQCRCTLAGLAPEEERADSDRRSTIIRTLDANRRESIAWARSQALPVFEPVSDAIVSYVRKNGLDRAFAFASNQVDDARPQVDALIATLYGELIPEYAEREFQLEQEKAA